MIWNSASYGVEAEQFDGENWGVIQAFAGKREVKDSPGWFVDNFADARDYVRDVSPGVTAVVWNSTHSIWLNVRVNDFIVKGLNGSLFPLDEETFHKMFNPANRGGGLISTQSFEASPSAQRRRFGNI